MRRMTNLVAAVTAAAAVLLPSAALPVAAAEPCPEVEVIFARGRVEPPGTGRIGEAFINAMRARTDKVLDYYAVDYPADVDVSQGANDMSRRIQYMAANCPNTRLVLGGYSLGAAVTDVVLAAPSPLLGYTNPLPLGMNDHVAAVVLFANGTRKVFGPVSDVSPLWGEKSIDICAPLDPICNDSMDANEWLVNWQEHWQPAYIDSGLVDQGADFAVARL